MRSLLAAAVRAAGYDAAITKGRAAGKCRRGGKMRFAVNQLSSGAYAGREDDGRIHVESSEVGLDIQVAT